MYQTLSFTMTGVSPLLMHNGQLADPLNEYSQRLKEFSSKRTKTDADHEAMAKVEFFGGLYTKDGVIGIPDKCIESMLIEGAKKNRLGKAFKAGVMCKNDFHRLKFKGSNDPEKLYEDGGYVYRELVKVTTSKIVRTRPMFSEWSLDVEVLFLSEVVTKKQVKEAFEIAGQLVGLGDYRPKFGRFNVK